MGMMQPYSGDCLVGPPKAGVEQRDGSGDGEKCSFASDEELLPVAGAQGHHRQDQRGGGGMKGALLQDLLSVWQCGAVPASRAHPPA